MEVVVTAVAMTKARGMMQLKVFAMSVSTLYLSWDNRSGAWSLTSTTCRTHTHLMAALMMMMMMMMIMVIVMIMMIRMTEVMVAMVVMLLFVGCLTS